MAFMQAAPAKDLSHYEILGLPGPRTGVRPTSKRINEAYRQALLVNHPDKFTPSTSMQESEKANQSATESLFTIDQISQARNVLMHPESRARYDAQILAASISKVEPHDKGARLQTEFETVDLDDIAFDETTARWQRQCRCGNDVGFEFSEDDLLEASDGTRRMTGNSELIVECPGCSLHLRVLFALAD